METSTSLKSQNSPWISNLSPKYFQLEGLLTCSQFNLSRYSLVLWTKILHSVFPAVLFLIFQQVQQATYRPEQRETRPESGEPCLDAAITSPVPTKHCQVLSPQLFLQIPKWCHACRAPQNRHRRGSLYFIPNSGTHEADFPDCHVRPHAISPNQELCILSHRYVPERNDYTATCDTQVSPNTFALLFSPPLLPYSLSWHLGEGPKPISPFLCKEGTEGTTPTSRFKGIRMDKAADFQSQKATLPKFPSRSLPTSESTSDPRRNHLPSPHVATLQLVKYHYSSQQVSKLYQEGQQRSISPPCLHEYEARRLKKNT